MKFICSPAAGARCWLARPDNGMFCLIPEQPWLCLQLQPCPLNFPGCPEPLIVLLEGNWEGIPLCPTGLVMGIIWSKKSLIWSLGHLLWSSELRAEPLVLTTKPLCFQTLRDSDWFPTRGVFSVQFCHGSLTSAFTERELCSFLCQEIWKPNSTRTNTSFFQGNQHINHFCIPWSAKCKAHTKQQQNPQLTQYLDKSPTEFTLELLTPKGILLQQRQTPTQETSICSPTFIPGSIPHATGTCLLVFVPAFAGKLPQIQHNNMWTGWVFFSISSYLFKQMPVDGFIAGCFYSPSLTTVNWTYSCYQLRIFLGAISSQWTHLHKIPTRHINL